MPPLIQSPPHSSAPPPVSAPDLPIVLACACTLIATICLLGWAAGIDVLVSVFDGLPAMVPLTAILTLLASCALGMRARAAHGGGGLAPSLLVVLLATAILLASGAQHLGWTFAATAGAESALRLSSPLTALMFLGLGLSLLALPHARYLRHAQWLALGVLSLALLTLASYLYRDTYLYQSLPGTGTALAVLAHELRNPLAPIRAAADLLRLTGGIDATQQRRSGEIIARQVEAMTHLVEDLLDVSRVRQGLITVERTPVDLRLVLADAMDQTGPLIGKRRHRLRTELPDRHPVVLGDHKRLVQIVANLLVNAAKYTPEGGEIVLALRSNAARAEISVSDNGVGMDAALLERVFDSFAQAAPTPGRAEGGLGIGLALVRSLVELHGGTVSAHSPGPGRGSTFLVVLPCAADDDAMAS